MTISAGEGAPGHGPRRPPAAGQHTISPVLDIALKDLVLRVLRGVNLTIPRSTHTAVVGLPGCGASTLLRLIAGVERPAKGSIVIGTQDVTAVVAERRPLLYATAELDVPGRWSVEHALVNAVRSRTLDRVDRHREVQLAAGKWQLDPTRKVDTLSGSEKATVHLARIELRKPAILIADRLLRDLPAAADEWYRTLRVMGATVVSAPSSLSELGLTDGVAVLEDGRIVQEGSAAAVFRAPRSLAAARSTGEVSVVPVVVRGTAVESPIGSWVADAPFQGAGIAVVRPDAFTVAKNGEESDFIFGIEEATFENGRWLARGLVTGATPLRVALPASEPVYKGRVLALRYDAREFTILPR